MSKGQFVPANQRQPGVKQGGLSPVENLCHLVATICTGGLWGLVWLARLRQVRDRQHVVR